MDSIYVEFEFLKNREITIRKPISQKYDSLKSKIQKLSKSFSSDIFKRIEEISRETIKDDKHPHIEQSEIDIIKAQAEDFKIKLKFFEEEVLKKIKKVEEEILSVQDNDDVLKALEYYFKVGEEYSFEKILEISREGEHRYKYEIPPGYGDLKKKEKKGTQIFGDLIIWNQILEYSKNSKKPIIFVINDIKKDDDWCYLDKNATEDRILRPREELIKEIKDFSNVELWMYNLPQFLYHANEYLEARIEEETIQNISQFLNTKETKGEYLKFKCSSCGRIHSYHKSEIKLVFECIDSSERKMGSENHHEAIVHFSCDCENEIEASFNIWEYPDGIHNNDSIKFEGATLLESFYFTIDFFDQKYELDIYTCDECTGNKYGIGNGVDFYSIIELESEFDDAHENHEYSSVAIGLCDWCQCLHLKCSKCGAINAVPDSHYDKRIECEGGCGLVYYVDSSNDTDHIGEYEIKLID